MSAFRRMLVVAVLCLGSLAVGQNQWQQSGEDVAARVFGPRWRQFARDADMIFSGTVVDVRPTRLGEQGQIPIVKIKLRIDHAIVGVGPRHFITIRQWAGAWSEHPMHSGQRVLLLLYPQSRLGLTSPIGGVLGQVTVSNTNTIAPRLFVAAGENGSPLRGPTESRTPIALSQLEQAIRTARASQNERASRRTLAEEE